MTYHAGLDRAAVIAAAAELADAEGLEQLTLAALAERLKVRTPTLYHYVNGLAGLRRELALLATRELGTRMGRAMMGRAGDDAVVAMAAAYRDYVKAHPGLYAASVRSSAFGDDAELKAAQAETTEMVFRALAAYRLSDEGNVHATRALRSLVHGFASLEVAGGFGMPIDVDESFNRLLDILLRGLKG